MPSRENGKILVQPAQEDQKNSVGLRQQQKYEYNAPQHQGTDVDISVRSEKKRTGTAVAREEYESSKHKKACNA